jgi:hypothetical protein
MNCMSLCVALLKVLNVCVQLCTTPRIRGGSCTVILLSSELCPSALRIVAR